MSEKRTKSDKAQRQADQLEKKAFRRSAQNEKKKVPSCQLRIVSVEKRESA
jgi:hypothetical protein